MESITQTLRQSGFINNTKITQTLQGSIWKAHQAQTNKEVIIKVTSKMLHSHSCAILNGKPITVQENIIKEKSILRYLCKHNAPKSIMSYQNLFQSDEHYHLLMQNGGLSLFNFITKTHQLIRNGHLRIDEWHKVVQIIFKQMIERIEWLHNTMNCIHLDTSLENWLIDEIDFGLADVSSKSPKVYKSAKKFDLRKNERYCLGIVLFTLLAGGTPWSMTHESDNAFHYFRKNCVLKLIKFWNTECFGIETETKTGMKLQRYLMSKYEMIANRFVIHMVLIFNVVI